MLNKLALMSLSILFTYSAQAQGLDKRQFSIVSDLVWAADVVGVPRELLVPLCWGEGVSAKLQGKNPTHLDGKGKNRTLSFGICQVKLETAQFMDYVYKLKIKATAKRLEDTKINSYYAAKYLKYQLDKYDGDWFLAVDAYNKHIAISNNTKYVKAFKKFKAITDVKFKTMLAHT